MAANALGGERALPAAQVDVAAQVARLRVHCHDADVQAQCCQALC
jgi:hypothetical protein